MMTTRRKALSILAMPAAFVGAFVLAFIAASLVWGVADAFAQPAAEEEVPTPTETERPAYGHAPPSDDMTNDTDDKIDGDAVKDAATAGALGDLSVDGSSNSPAGKAAHGHGHHGGDLTENWNWLGIHYGKDIAGGKFGDGQNFDPKTGKLVEGPEQPMSGAFIFMVLNFAVLLLLLVWKGKPIAQNMARERHDQIKSALDEAAKLRKQAQDKLAEYETKLKDADSEIKKLVDGMREDAEADKVRILENAAKQSAQMKREAEQRIAAEIEMARAALTREVTAAATAATEKLLRAKMLPGDQQKLVGSFITDLHGKTEPATAKERS